MSKRPQDATGMQASTDETSSAVVMDEQRECHHFPAAEVELSEDVDQDQLCDSSRASSPFNTPRSILSPTRAPKKERFLSPPPGQTQVKFPDVQRPGIGATSVVDMAQLQAVDPMSEDISSRTLSPPAKPARTILSPDRSTASSRARTLSPPANKARVTSPEQQHRGFGSSDKRSFSRQAVTKRNVPTRPSMTSRRIAAPVKAADDAETALRETIEKLEKELAAEQAGKQEAITKLDQDEKNARALADEAVTYLEQATKEAGIRERELMEKLRRAEAAAAQQAPTDASTATDSPQKKEVKRVGQALEEARAEKEELQEKLTNMQNLLADREKQINDLKQAAEKSGTEVSELSEKLKNAQREEGRAKEAAKKMETYRAQSLNLKEQVQKLQDDLRTIAESALSEQNQRLRDQQLKHQAEVQGERNTLRSLMEQAKNDQAKLGEMQKTIDMLTGELLVYKEGTHAEREIFLQNKLHLVQGELDRTGKALKAAQTEVADLLHRLGMHEESGPSNSSADDGADDFTEDRV